MALSWVWAALLLAIVANVTLRYVFGSGRIEFEEVQWHLYALGFLAGLSYGVQSDSHVRVDVLSERFSPRTLAWVELYGVLLLLVPFIALIVTFGVPFAWESWRSGEVSPSPGGLPQRWLIKSALPLGFALLGLATLGRLARVFAFLFGAGQHAATDLRPGSGR
jgi:TRAP-type mannitol/chloroaromatic compound transport system permease small subunit